MMQMSFERMVRQGLRAVVVGVVTVWVVLKAQSLCDYARLNQLSLDTARWFLTNNISARDLGLRLEYGERFAPGARTTFSADDCESSNARLSLRVGVIEMLTGNWSAAARCFSTTLAVSPGAPDALVLAVDAYHLTGQKTASTTTFERLPQSAQSIATIAALAIFDYLPVATPGANRLGGIIPRKVLFDLASSKPEIAWRFLDKAIQAGVLSAMDRSDMLSIENWEVRRARLRASLQPAVNSADTDPRHRQALRQSVAASIGCAESSIDVGSNLLSAGAFEQPQDLNLWRILPWTSGSKRNNRGAFVFGLDTPDESNNSAALRISGLWKEDDPQLYPASGSFELSAPLRLLEGKNLYLMLIRYKTENGRAGETDIWFDSVDYRRFVGVWRLGASDGVWQERYALGYVDGDATPTVTPMISHRALGTVWIDYLQLIPTDLRECVLGDRAVFGKVMGQE
jgi:hypothetical protein